MSDGNRRSSRAYHRDKPSRYQFSFVECDAVNSAAKVSGDAFANRSTSVKPCTELVRTVAITATQLHLRRIHGMVVS